MNIDAEPRTRTKRVKTRGGPEMKEYWKDVKMPVLLKRGTPVPPPNFTPGQKAITSDENHPPILSNAQGYEQASEDKEN